MSQTIPYPRALLGALGWAQEVYSVTPVRGGWDTAIWRVESEGRAYALRLFRPGQAAVARREAIAMRLTVPGVPIPAVRAAGQWHGRPVLLIDWCAGRTLLDALRATPQRCWTLARLFGASQARLHAVPPPTALLAEGRSWIDWSGGGAGSVGERLRAVATGSPSVLHFDYHPLNLLVAGTRVTGLIDWTNVHVGDRRADLARTLTILRLAPFPPGQPAVLLRILSRLLEMGWRQGYRAVAGPLDGMAPFYVWAGLALINDLTPRIDQPGGWLREEHLAPARQWVAYWRRRAGLPESG